MPRRKRSAIRQLLPEIFEIDPENVDLAAGQLRQEFRPRTTGQLGRAFHRDLAFPVPVDRCQERQLVPLRIRCFSHNTHPMWTFATKPSPSAIAMGSMPNVSKPQRR